MPKDMNNDFSDLAILREEFDRAISLQRNNLHKVDQLPRLAEADLARVRTGQVRKVGYIVGTCSPVTKGHLTLVQQAADQMGLDMVYFVLWPFHYIKGFHSGPLNNWVTEQRHVEWEDRMEILNSALDVEGDPRLRSLTDAKGLYQASERNFDPSDDASSFWTGTWFVLRALQKALQIEAPLPIEFTFICGADQFNPNVNATFAGDGVEKVWKDYALGFQLALHNIYAVPRTADGSDLIPFHTPSGYKYQVVQGAPLTLADMSATKIRFRRLECDLENVCPMGAVRQIKLNGHWGYGQM